jgi:hypothetical protein
MARRTEHGVTAQFNELLAGEIQVRYFNDMPMPADTPKGIPRKSHTLHREIPKISTSDAPGG